MSNKPTVVITGANGFLGSNLVNHFLKQGWKINALVRTIPDVRVKNVTYFVYDLSQRVVPEKAFESADYLIHAAYVKFNTTNKDAMKVNLSAAQRIVAVADKYNLKKKLFMSTMSAHANAESVYGKQKLRIEALFTDKRSVVVRSGLILGNGGIVKDMVDFMKSKHAVPLVGGGKQPLQVVGVYDLCRVLEKLLKDFSGSFTIATPEVYTYKEFYQAISKQINTWVLYVPLPFFALLAAIKTIRFLKVPINVSEDNALGLKHLTAVDTQPSLDGINEKLDNLQDILAKPGIIT